MTFPLCVCVCACVRMCVCASVCAFLRKWDNKTDDSYVIFQALFSHKKFEKKSFYTVVCYNIWMAVYKIIMLLL